MRVVVDRMVGVGSYPTYGGHVEGTLTGQAKALADEVLSGQGGVGPVQRAVERQRDGALRAAGVVAEKTERAAGVKAAPAVEILKPLAEIPTWASPVLENLLQPCRRCGHPKTGHRAQGCLGACVCSEKRYLAS
jgi:hypothetical protein